METAFASMNGRLLEFKDLFKEELFYQPIDFDLLVDGVNSIPLHNRLGIKEDLLTASEKEKFNKIASSCYSEFKEKLKIKECQAGLDLSTEQGSEFISCLSSEADQREFYLPAECTNRKTEAESDEKFLKFFYHSKGNDQLISTLLKDFNYSFPPTLKVKSKADNALCHNSEVSKKFLEDISFGKYDDLAKKSETIQSSSSSSDSEEEMDLRAINLTRRLKFVSDTPGTKLCFLKRIQEDSLARISANNIVKEKQILHPNDLFYSSSDDELNCEIRGKKYESENKNLHKINQPSLKNEFKIKSETRNKHSNFISTSDKKNSSQKSKPLLKQTNKMKSFKESCEKTDLNTKKHQYRGKALEKSSVPVSVVPTGKPGANSNARNFEHPPSASVSSTSNIHPIDKEKFTNKGSIGKQIKKSDSSSDEDWESLAQKNLNVVDNLLRPRK